MSAMRQLLRLPSPRARSSQTALGKLPTPSLTFPICVVETLPPSTSVWKCWCAPGREPALPTLKHHAGGRGGLEGCSSCLTTALHFRLFVFVDRRTPASYLARRGPSVDTFGPVLRAWVMGKACCDLWLQAVPKPKKCHKLGRGANIQLHQGPLDTCCRTLEASGLPMLASSTAQSFRGLGLLCAEPCAAAGWAQNVLQGE